MKKIILNEDYLDEKRVELKMKKVRALIVDDNNMVTLCNYCDVYMLPGGKVEDNELTVDGLIRELGEELGLSFDKREFKELVTVVNMAKNYPIRDSNKKINRICETDYYLIRSNKKINKSRIKLTDSELKNNFRIEYVPLNRVLEVICNNEHRNYRNKYFIKEILVVLNEYLNGRCFYLEDGLIDMHIHTDASDGEKNADEIVKMAIDKKAQAISITDHDTILGYKNLVYDKGMINLIPGIELSAFSEVGRLHILGYGFDLSNKVFNERLREFHQNSINNILELVSVLERDYDIKFDYKDIEELINLERNIARPDLARLLVRYGIVKTIPEAFDRYLVAANDKIRHLVRKPSYKECFSLIKEASGVPVIAHPHSLLLDDNSLYYQLLEMKKYGLQGIEAYHSNVPKQLSDNLISFAMEHNLYITGGSDYHGPISKADIELFSGRNNNINIKHLSLVKDLRNRT